MPHTNKSQEQPQPYTKPQTLIPRLARPRGTSASDPHEQPRSITTNNNNNDQKQPAATQRRRFRIVGARVISPGPLAQPPVSNTSAVQSFQTRSFTQTHTNPLNLSQKNHEQNPNCVDSFSINTGFGNHVSDTFNSRHPDDSITDLQQRTDDILASTDLINSSQSTNRILSNQFVFDVSQRDLKSIQTYASIASSNVVTDSLVHSEPSCNNASEILLQDPELVLASLRKRFGIDHAHESMSNSSILSQQINCNKNVASESGLTSTNNLVLTNHDLQQPKSSLSQWPLQPKSAWQEQSASENQKPTIPSHSTVVAETINTHKSTTIDLDSSNKLEEMIVRIVQSVVQKQPTVVETISDCNSESMHCKSIQNQNETLLSLMPQSDMHLSHAQMVPNTSQERIGARCVSVRTSPECFRGRSPELTLEQLGPDSPTNSSLMPHQIAINSVAVVEMPSNPVVCDVAVDTSDLLVNKIPEKSESATDTIGLVSTISTQTQTPPDQTQNHSTHEKSTETESIPNRVFVDASTQIDVVDMTHASTQSTYTQTVNIATQYDAPTVYDVAVQTMDMVDMGSWLRGSPGSSVSVSSHRGSIDPSKCMRNDFTRIQQTPQPPTSVDAIVVRDDEMSNVGLVERSFVMPAACGSDRQSINHISQLPNHDNTHISLTHDVVDTDPVVLYLRDQIHATQMELDKINMEIMDLVRCNTKR